mgnify:CR=1 FL=1
MSELNLPSDPMILLSFINTKLRDFYPSLDALCEDANISKDENRKKALRHRLYLQRRA